MIVPILIVGQTGTGKSTSYENLPRDRTAILNSDKKQLPFNTEDFALYGKIESTSQMIAGIKAIEKNDKIEYVVIDTITIYARDCVFKEKAKGKGWPGWDEYTSHLFDITDNINKSKKKYIVIAHEVKGETIEGKEFFCSKLQAGLKNGDLEERFPIVFRSVCEDDINADDGVKFSFVTNQVPGIKTTARTPRGMFKEKYIENDITKAYKTIEEHYKNNQKTK